MSSAPSIVVTIEGLRASALGAYGNTWYPTLGLDRLAAESCVYDGCYIASPDRQAALGLFAQSIASAANSPEGVAVTDCGDSIAALGLVVEGVRRIEPPTPKLPADSIEEAHIARMCAELLDAIASQPTPPSLAWLHLRGMLGPWDAPHALAVELCDEDDPQPLPSTQRQVIVAEGSYTLPADVVFQESCRYAAQVIALDTCIEGLLMGLDAHFGEHGFDFLLAGLSGYSLGEQGKLGGDPMTSVYSSGRHIPLLARRADGAGRLHRDASLLTESLMAGGLSQGTISDDPAAEVFLRGNGSAALRTPDWLLISQPGSYELYAKPDDRWEANDVASRCATEVDSLAARLESILDRTTDNPVFSDPGQSVASASSVVRPACS